MTTQDLDSQDDSEQLRLLGLRCAVSIKENPSAWTGAAEWLKNLPTCAAVGHVTDPDHPILQDGRKWMVDPDSIPGHPYYVYDNEADASRSAGPIFRRLMSAWMAAIFRFRDRSSDRYFDFCETDARRITLLAAYTLNRDFNGSEFGLNWRWETPDSSETGLEGRGWARAGITGANGASESLIEYITTATKYLATVEDGASRSVGADTSQPTHDHPSDKQDAEQSKQGVTLDQGAGGVDSPPGDKSKRYSTRELKTLTGLRNNALNMHAKSAGVTTPGRGKRNHQYSKDDVKKILTKIIEKSPEELTIRKCKKSLGTVNNRF